MAARMSQFKLGVLAIVAVVALVIAAMTLGLHLGRAPTVTYYTFFDESVQGLEVGSPVKYRGVRIGNVTAIGIARDGRHVEVRLAIFEAQQQRLELDGEHGPILRARLATQGVTGVKFVDLDFFAGEAPPLPFPAPPHTIPSQRSLLKGVAESVETLTTQLGGVLDRMAATMESIERFIDEVRTEQIPERIGIAIDGATSTLASMRRVVAGIDRAAIPAKTAATLAKLDGAIARIDRIMAKVDGDDGLLARARRATDAVGSFGRAATGSVGDLDETLREVADAARSLRELTDEIERDPDMLLKGRARRRSP